LKSTDKKFFSLIDNKDCANNSSLLSTRLSNTSSSCRASKAQTHAPKTKHNIIIIIIIINAI